MNGIQSINSSADWPIPLNRRNRSTNRIYFERRDQRHIIEDNVVVGVLHADDGRLVAGFQVPGALLADGVHLLEVGAPALLHLVAQRFDARLEGRLHPSALVHHVAAHRAQLLRVLQLQLVDDRLLADAHLTQLLLDAALVAPQRSLLLLVALFGLLQRRIVIRLIRIVTNIDRQLLYIVHLKIVNDDESNLY